MNMDTIKEIDVKSVMTKSSLPVGGYSVNPYVGCPHACRYCYASFMKRFTGHTEPWGTFLDVKNWKPITNPHKYDGERVVIGSVTDGYNPYEEEFHRTRRLLEELRGSDAEIMICTKSDLVLRDLDLLKSFPKVTVSWSVNTLDEQFCADMDNAVSIERRLKAMRQTYEAGIRTVCFVSPIFPRITDVKAIIEEVKDYADLIWLENLNLRGQFKGGIMTYIREKYPDLIPLYEEIYNKKRLEYWQALEQDISNYAKEQGAHVIGISCNPGSQVEKTAEIAITPTPGPEVVTGSTRMKSGTAQKMVLNMLSTGAMIKLGKVYGNLMVDVKPTNAKLVERCKRIVCEATGVDYDTATEALEKCGYRAKVAIVMLKTGSDVHEAEQRLEAHEGRVAQAVGEN